MSEVAVESLDDDDDEQRETSSTLSEGRCNRLES